MIKYLVAEKPSADGLSMAPGPLPSAHSIWPLAMSSARTQAHWATQVPCEWVTRGSVALFPATFSHVAHGKHVHTYTHPPNTYTHTCSHTPKYLHTHMPTYIHKHTCTHMMESCPLIQRPLPASLPCGRLRHLTGHVEPFGSVVSGQTWEWVG